MPARPTSQRVHDVLVSAMVGIAPDEEAFRALLHPGAKLADDLGVNSLDALAIAQDVEAEFGITIPDEEAAAWATVNDIVAFVEKATKNPQDGSGLGDC